MKINIIKINIIIMGSCFSREIKKEGIPYKYNGVSGWLLNIEEFQPEY